MRKQTITLLLAATFAAAPTLALAESRGMQESRFINGTVGAVAGALIGGPIGLLAGAAIGYTVGPEIVGPQKTWQTRRVVRRHVRRKRARHATSQNCPCGPQPYAGYAAQPMYMAPPQYGYAPYPGQPPAYQQQQRYYNPRQNALVPSPDAMAMARSGGYSAAAVSNPYAPGQQGAGGAYGAAYTAPSPQGYGYGQVRAAPVPMPR